MGVYLFGTVLMMSLTPIIFIPGVNNFWLTLFAGIFSKIGNGFCIFSHVTMISVLTNSRSRRVPLQIIQKKLVSKITQFGLGATFLIMLFMMIVSKYMSFSYKFLFGVCIYVFVGALCSIAFMYKIQENQLEVYNQDAVDNSPSVSWSKQPRFYIYGVIAVFGTLYSGIISAVFPYFVKYFENITQFKYLACVMLLYLFCFIGAMMSGKLFMFTGIRPMISVGMICAIISMLFYVFSF